MGQRRVLSFSDRMEIATGFKAGWTMWKIARDLGRCPSVISRDIRRNRYLHTGISRSMLIARWSANVRPVLADLKRGVATSVTPLS